MSLRDPASQPHTDLTSRRAFVGRLLALAGQRSALMGPLSALAGGVSALAAAGAALPASARQADVLRMAVTRMPSTLDPRFATDATSARVNRLLYSSPVAFDARFLAVPDLCDFEGGPRRWRVTLRGAAQFVGGGAVTATDVAATYRSVLDVDTGSPHRGSLAGVTRIDVIDARRLDFHLREDDALFPGKLVVGVLPAELLASDHDFGERPVGSGPFEFVGGGDQQPLRLRRRRDGLALEFERVSDPTVRVLKLLRGEVDLVQNDIPPEVVRWLAARDEVRITRGPGSNYAYLGFNLADPLTGDARLRRAIAHALDREAVIEHLLGGAARLATAILVPEHWAGAPDLAPIGHDVDLARSLVAEMGYGPGRPLPLTYKTSSDPFRLRLATVIQAQLAEAHIDVALRSYDWGTFYADIKAGNFQLFSLAWVGVKLPDIFRYTLHSASVPPAGANRGRYASARADALIEAAEAAETVAERAAHYGKLQALLAEELPYVPLWHEDHVFAARRGLTGYSIAPDGAWDALADVEWSPAVAG